MGAVERGFLSDLGGATKRRAKLLPRHAKRAARTPGKKSTSTMASTLMKAAYGGHLRASAERSSIEQMRPNRLFTLATATPATAIASGVSTGALTVQIPGNAFICAFYATQQDEVDFLVTSLQVNGYESIGSSNGVNLAAFVATAGRIDRPGPLVGRKFQGNVTVTGAFTNTNAAARVFHGLVIATIAPECGTTGDAGQPAPGIFNFNNVKRSFVSLLPRRGK
jgi:hypothetical protein